MQFAQRVLGITGIAVMLLVAANNIFVTREKRLQTQWERVHTELFLEQISRSREISLEDYQKYMWALGYIGTDTKIWIEEYRKEWDGSGTEYEYPVTWNELEAYLSAHGSWQVQQESVIRLVIQWENDKKSFRKEAFTIVAGKE